MAYDSHREFNSLRCLVVRLAKELDYKNHLLMEKEGLTLERFATMSSLIEEKDRLLVERADVIGSLMSQKHRLHEDFVEEMRKCECLKKEMKNIRHEVEVLQRQLDTSTMDQEELLALNGKGLQTVTTNSTNANKHDNLQNGLKKEVTDENDKKLAELREEWGEEACKAVVNALLDLRKYSPSMSSSIPELWNFEEGRRANMKEVIQYIIQRWEVHRNKDNEKSGAITELMAEKESLIGKLAGINILMEEKDKLLKEKHAEIAKLMAQDKEKDKVLEKMSATISTLTAEKHIVLESCNAEKIKTRSLEEQIEKLMYEKQSQVVLAKQPKEYKETRSCTCGSGKSLAIKEENLDWYLEFLIDQGGPAKKLKDSKVHDSKRQISSTSENKKFKGQCTGEIFKLPKDEPDMFGEPSEGRWDVSGVSRPIIQSYLLPSKIVIPSPSYSVALEKNFQVINMKKEDEE